MNDNTYYNLGKRDSLAQIFMLLRNNNLDFKKTFEDLTEQYKKLDDENPHCEWVKDRLKKL